MNKKSKSAQTVVFDAWISQHRRPDDLLRLFTNLGIALIVLLAGFFARGTTRAVANDIQTVVNQSTFDQILLLPLAFLQNTFTLLAPFALIIYLLTQKKWRQVGQTVATGISAGLIAVLVTKLISYLPLLFQASLLVWGVSTQVIAVPTGMVAITAMITMGGERRQDRLIRWLWRISWAILLLSVLQIRMTLTSAVLTVLLGNTLGLLGRYTFGVEPTHAGASQIITALRQLGLKPAMICRIDYFQQLLDQKENLPPKERNTGSSTEKTKPTDGELACKYHYQIDENGLVTSGGYQKELLSPNEYEQAWQQMENSLPQGAGEINSGVLRIYQVWDESGHRYRVYAGDQETEFTQWVTALWNRIRLRGLQRTTSTNHRQSGEYAAMMAMLVERSEIPSLPYYGMVQAGDTILNIWHSDVDIKPLASCYQPLTGPENPIESPGQVGIAKVFDQLWAQIIRAHRLGLAHRNLDLNSIYLSKQEEVYLLDWEMGEAAASEISKYLDVVQLLTLSAYYQGTQAALAQANQYLPVERLLRIIPFCQKIALPPQIRALAQKQELLPQLVKGIGKLVQQAESSKELENQLIEAETKVVELRRFSPKTVALSAMGVIAISIVFGSLDFQQLLGILRQASTLWILTGFACALLMSAGQAITFQAISPVRLPFARTYLVQIAGALTALVAPAGLGAAALNARYLVCQRVRTSISVATVTLFQIFQVVSSFALLFLMLLFTGNSLNVQRPSTTLLITVAVLLVVTAGIMTIPVLRQWTWKKIGPTLQGIGPRLVWITSSPQRIVATIGGVIWQSVVQVACFYCSLTAFGQSISLAVLAVTFLVSNSVGSIIPTPGGLGPVEAALTAGLQVAGVPTQTALATALLYRLLTFWTRAALGWFALKYLQNKQAI